MPNKFLNARTVIVSLRDNGYKNTAYALGELIDNSIQAKATRVELCCIEDLSDSSSRRNYSVTEIALWDNGIGMSPETLLVAMKFGGSINRLDNKGMGKFGMGLPNSSISQCKHVDVWSWQDGNLPFHTYLDVDDMTAGHLEQVPDPVESDIPEIYKKAFFKNAMPQSGTLIIWRKLDRLNWKTGKSIFTHCQNLVGRMYRYFIHEDKVKIDSVIYRKSSENMLSEVERYTFKANDPLYLMKNTSFPKLPSDYSAEAFFELVDEEKISVSYVNSSGELISDDVIVRSSIVKKSIANKILENSTCRLGSTEWGKVCGKHMGVSIVRAERELVLNNEFMEFLPKDFKEYKCRFMGVEVKFPPSLDELFGVLNNKQDAVKLRPYDRSSLLESSGFVTKNEYDDDLKENNDPLYEIFKVTDAIRAQIVNARSKLNEVNVEPLSHGNNSSASGATPAEKATSGSIAREGQGITNPVSQVKSTPDEIAKVLRDKTGCDEDTAKTEAENIVLKGLRYHIGISAMDSDAFFDVSRHQGLTLVRFNSNHIFYNEFIIKLSDDERAVLETAMAGFAQVMNEESVDERRSYYLNEIRRLWGKVISQFLVGPSGNDDMDFLKST